MVADGSTINNLQIQSVVRAGQATLTLVLNFSKNILSAAVMDGHSNNPPHR
jgi:hypothetical protein